MTKEIPKIRAMLDGPYVVKGVVDFINSKKGQIKSRKVMCLCRCGGSKNKPFCDSTHEKLGFTGDKESDTAIGKIDNYKGKRIIIHDNRSVCAHSGICTDNLKKVFKLGKDPWIAPNGAKVEKISEFIKECPSGALSYSIGKKLYKNIERDPAIIITKNGPYKIVGYPELIDKQNKCKPESREHYTLCRCGHSKNKPLCDGSHWTVKFKDPKN